MKTLEAMRADLREEIAKLEGIKMEHKKKYGEFVGADETTVRLFEAKAELKLLESLQEELEKQQKNHCECSGHGYKKKFDEEDKLCKECMEFKYCLAIQEVFESKENFEIGDGMVPLPLFTPKKETLGED